MDERLIREIITDYENLIHIINGRLQKLYNMLGEVANTEQQHSFHPKNMSSLKNEIEKRNNEMQLRIEKLRQDAMKQAQASMDQASKINNMPLLNPNKLGIMPMVVNESVGEKDGKKR